MSLSINEQKPSNVAGSTVFSDDTTIFYKTLIWQKIASFIKRHQEALFIFTTCTILTVAIITLNVFGMLSLGFTITVLAITTLTGLGAIWAIRNQIKNKKKEQHNLKTEWRYFKEL